MLTKVARVGVGTFARRAAAAAAAPAGWLACGDGGLPT